MYLQATTNHNSFQRLKTKKLDYTTENLEFLSNGDLKKLGDYWMRRYLLNHAEKRNGKIFCPLKKQWYIEDKIHVAHFIDRACMQTRYDLNNCHLTSLQSNTWDAQIPKEGYKSLHHYEYEIWIRNKIGEKEFEELLHKSKELRIFTKEDYIQVINKFRDGN